MLAGFTLYHYGMVAGYALLFVAAHLLLALGALRYAGRRLPTWPFGAGAAMLVLAFAALLFGSAQRAELTARLTQNLAKEIPGVCQQAQLLITGMGGDASPDDEPLREKFSKRCVPIFRKRLGAVSKMTDTRPCRWWNPDRIRNGATW